MSQAEAASTEIGGKNYEVYMLPPMESHHHLMNVAKMIGPALGPVIDSVMSNQTGDGELDMEAELGSEFFSKAAGELFGNFDQKIMDQVIVSLRKVTFVGGAKLDQIFDVHFMGELDAMYQWLVFAMKVQWGKSLSALVNGLASKAPSRKDKTPG